MIKEINENFSYEVDQHNWILHQWFDGKTKDGEPKRTSKKTYYGTLLQMLKAIIDKSLKDSIDFKSISDLSEQLTNDLKKLEISK